MYCPKCNSYADANAKFCGQCGAALSSGHTQFSDAQDSSENYKDEYTYGNGNYQNTDYRNGYYHSKGYYGNSGSAQNNYSYSGSGYNYNQPTGELTPHLNNTFSIVMLIVNLIIFNVFGLIFAVLSLLNYNKYEEALRFGNYLGAEEFKKKSSRYAKISLILQLVLFVIGFIAGIAAFLFGFVSVTGSVFEGDLFDFDLAMRGNNLLMNFIH